ncbi:MAG: aconitate hydratase AcnA [Ideonella sp.]|nr:aconitate hydratase AcnA [Ideonella sp.]
MPAAKPYTTTLRSFRFGDKGRAQFCSLPALAEIHPNVSRMPISLRIVLESVLRNCDGRKVTEEHVRQLANWQPNAARTEEIPFIVARVVLQDFTGVPLLADLAAMRTVTAKLGRDPKTIEPLVPVDLVVDHSIMIDYFGRKDALDLNMKLEFERNRERYEFMKWGMQAFDTFGVVPPGFGIVHQVNLEYLARGVHRTADGVYYPDTLVGTDSHTTMINGLGVLGWGVGGIEAEAVMLGQPIPMLVPQVVGFKLTGRLPEGATATDLVLRVTQMLRAHGVVDKFVEFFGDGLDTMPLATRATIANMAPEYGATCGFFPVDQLTLDYMALSGRDDELISTVEIYCREQGLWRDGSRKTHYSAELQLNLGEVTPALAGPKRPQDRIDLTSMKSQWYKDLADSFGVRTSAASVNKGSMADEGGAAAAEQTSSNAQALTEEPGVPVNFGGKAFSLNHGAVVIAAITSCTNTSNPGVLLAAGLLAKKAVQAGLKVPPHVKTSLAPGSRIVTEYLTKTGLLPYLEQLGFGLAAYGCTTCIGNAGDLAPEFNKAIVDHDLVCAAVLSGNRNFEARIHPNLKANFLASPPLVVAYAIAGNVMRDLMTEPVGKGKNGRDVFLGDIWPSSDEVYALLKHAMNPKAFQANYAKVKTEPGALWGAIKGVTGQVYDWPASTYIANPPFFEGFTIEPPAAASSGVSGARIMALFGDSITTDHISPAGSIKETSPAGRYLIAHNVTKADFNSYGSRRGNHEVMMRGTFANVRIKNLMIPPKADGSREEGGVTLHQPKPGSGAGAAGEKMAIYDAAMRYMADGVPTVIFAGEEYGTGSSRDWAAKGTQLLGIKAVVAKSFERIHRSNLVGMGVLPLQFAPGQSWQSLDLRGDETIDIVVPQLKPQAAATLVITGADGTRREAPLTLRIDTPIEVDYYRHGGILPFVLRQLLAA